MTTDTPSSKPWFQKKRYIIAMVLVVLAIIGQFTGSSEPEAPATLAISDIKDMSGFDEENNDYYWGATFRITELEPTTKVNCTVKAIDANGGVLIEETYEGNTLNEGTIIKYGEEGLTSTTKEIVEAISTFDVSCTKK
jgi:hypothetical protein